MVVMKYFCFYFPVRLGVIITSSFTCFQSLVTIGYTLMYDVEYLQNLVKETVEKIDEYSSNEYFNKFLEYADECEWN
jgi:hypothetical protein